jgi:large subunit ribosomal protein L14e
MLNDIGRLCMKIAGRDANRTCVIVEVIDANYVMVDGETRRKKVNIKHLEPLDKIIEIKKGASHAEVKKAFSALGMEIKDTKPKKATEKPKKMKAKKAVAEAGKKAN